MRDFRGFDIVQEKICHCQKIRQGLFLPTVNRRLQEFEFFRGIDFADMRNGYIKSWRNQFFRLLDACDKAVSYLVTPYPKRAKSPLQGSSGHISRKASVIS